MQAMDENAIFKTPSELGKQQEPEKEAQPTIPPASSVPPVVPSVRPLPSQHPAFPKEELPKASSSSMIFRILKIFLLIGFIAGVAFLVFNFILPKFFNPAGNKITLVYWGLNRDVSEIQPVISEFEKNNPNIKIEYSKLDIKEYKEKLIIRSNNGNGPDIFQFHNSWTAMLSDLLLPLPQETISKEEFTKNYYPVTATDLIRNGAIYGIPLQIDTLNLYINKDLFEAAGLKTPADWIEFGDYARQLTVKDESNNIKTSGAAMGTFANINHAPSILSMLFVQNGVNLNDMSSNIPAAADALNFYTSFAFSPSNVWDETLDQSIKKFSSGSLAMYFGYSWDFFTIKEANPNLSFDIFPVPKLPGQNATIASYWVEGVSSKSKHQKETLLFIKYLAQKEVQQKLFIEQSKAKIFGEPYSRKDLSESLKDSIFYSFVENAPDAASSFFVGDTYDNGINTQMNKHLENAINSILNGTSPESAAQTLSQSVMEVLAQFGQ